MRACVCVCVCVCVWEAVLILRVSKGTALSLTFSHADAVQPWSQVTMATVNLSQWLPHGNSATYHRDIRAPLEREGSSVSPW